MDCPSKVEDLEVYKILLKGPLVGFENSYYETNIYKDWLMV